MQNTWKVYSTSFGNLWFTFGYNPSKFLWIRQFLKEVLCLTELRQIYRKQNECEPVTKAFFDIKSAYHTVDCNKIWSSLQSFISIPLISLLQNVFDNISIKILIKIIPQRYFILKQEYSKSPILSPYLYLVYINTFPTFLRPSPLEELDYATPIQLASKINFLLYADDVIRDTIV